MPRILTYNVHRCVGIDRRLDVGRVAEVIAAAGAGHRRPAGAGRRPRPHRRRRPGARDRRAPGMAFHFNAALQVEEEQYGDAILTACPSGWSRPAPCPGHPRLARLEPRGALWVAIEIGGARAAGDQHPSGPGAARAAAAGRRPGRRGLAGPTRLRGAPLILLGDLQRHPRDRGLSHPRRQARDDARRRPRADGRSVDLSFALAGPAHRPRLRQRGHRQCERIDAPSRPARPSGVRSPAAGGGFRA